MTEEEKIDIQRVIEELTKRGATQPCARCGHQSFAIEQDFITLQVQTSLKTLSIGRATIPAAVVVCKHCGAITLHALGVLGMLPPQNNATQPPAQGGKAKDAESEAK